LKINPDDKVEKVLQNLNININNLDEEDKKVIFNIIEI
jgi:hypothetical protein